MESRSYFKMMFGDINPDDGGQTFSIDETDFTNPPRQLPPRLLEKYKEAYTRAHEIRKFEIELYWKRATYFWAFELVALTGFGALFFKLPMDTTCESTHLNAALFLVSIGGAAITYLWWLVLCGSKSWQRNWEKHIDMLEYYFSGNLYKCMFLDCKNPFSSSKASAYIAFSFLIFWIICLIFASYSLLESFKFEFQTEIFSTITFFTALVIAINFTSLRLKGSPHKAQREDYPLTLRCPAKQNSITQIAEASSCAVSRPGGAQRRFARPQRRANHPARRLS